MTRPGPLDPSLEGPGRMKQVQDAEVSQVKFLKNKDPRVRSRAAENLARLGPQAKFAIFPLSQRLRDADANVRCRAATALGEIGSAAVEELIHALSLPDANIRREAVWALAKMGPEAEPAVGALARVLADRDLAVRKGAARALGLLDRLACPAIPFLIAALNDTDLFFCRLAAWALGKIGAPPAISTSSSTQRIPEIRGASHSSKKTRRRSGSLAAAVRMRSRSCSKRPARSSAAT